MQLDATNVTPYGMNVLVKRLPLEGIKEKTEGGLWLPETAGERNVFCELLKCGNGEVRDNGLRVPATTRKPGDIVALRTFDGIAVSSLHKDILVVDGRKIEGARSSAPWPNKV